jgi:hypothetical protein
LARVILGTSCTWPAFKGVQATQTSSYGQSGHPQHSSGQLFLSRNSSRLLMHRGHRSERRPPAGELCIFPPVTSYTAFPVCRLRVFPGIEHPCRATLLLFRMYHKVPAYLHNTAYVSSDASMKAFTLAGESHVSTQSAQSLRQLSSLKQTLSMSVLWVLQMEASIQRNVSSYGQS